MTVHRPLRALSTVLIISGLLMLCDAALTVAWQEPVSALYARIVQDRLGDDLGADRRGLQVIELDAHADRRAVRVEGVGDRVAACFLAQRDEPWGAEDFDDPRAERKSGVGLGDHELRVAAHSSFEIHPDNANKHAPMNVRDVPGTSCT